MRDVKYTKWGDIIFAIVLLVITIVVFMREKVKLAGWQNEWSEYQRVSEAQCKKYEDTVKEKIELEQRSFSIGMKRLSEEASSARALDARIWMAKVRRCEDQLENLKTMQDRLRELHGNAYQLGEGVEGRHGWLVKVDSLGDTVVVRYKVNGHIAQAWWIYLYSAAGDLLFKTKVTLEDRLGRFFDEDSNDRCLFVSGHFKTGVPRYFVVKERDSE